MPREHRARSDHHPLDWLSDAACATGTGELDPDFFPEDRPSHRPGQTFKSARKRIEDRAKEKCNGVATVVQRQGEAVVTWGRPPCPVREQCLALALKIEGPSLRMEHRYGVFGGMNPDERLAHQAALNAAADGGVAA